MVNPGQGILTLQHGLLKCANAGEHRGCCGSGAYPGLLPPFTPPSKPPFFQLKILDSQMLTGCSWEICTCLLPLWSSSDEDCGLHMVTGGESSWMFSLGTQRSSRKKMWVQASLQNCVFTRTALTCFVLTDLFRSFSRSDFWLTGFS